MQSRTLTKNCFTTGGYARRDNENIVFISYRREHPDIDMARDCAERLENTPGLHYWLDEDDECMQQAHSINDEVQKALCIEQGLDVASALLGIIGPNTFDSPWIPYEIGGFRGRKQSPNGFGTLLDPPPDSPPDPPHPLIAHFIHEVDLHEVPAFVTLGYPLISLDEVEQWLESVEFLLVGDLIEYDHKQQELQDIYARNANAIYGGTVEPVFVSGHKTFGEEQ